jgi:hypothetical protein
MRNKSLAVPEWNILERGIEMSWQAADKLLQFLERFFR